MILEKGNMWDVFGKTDLFLITTNPIRRADGCLVMGRGIALEAVKKYPSIAIEFGIKVAKDRWYQNYDDVMHPVHCGAVGKFGGQLMGYFMVKDHWQEPAKLGIIEHSVRELNGWAGNPSLVGSLRRYDLNFPGIGNGRLKREEVLPIIEQLPDNVHVWEYGE